MSYRPVGAMSAIFAGAIAASTNAAAQTSAEIGWSAPIDCSTLGLNDNPAMLPLLSFSTRGRFATPSADQRAPVVLSQLEGGQGYTRLRMQFVPCTYVAPSFAVKGQVRRAYFTEDRNWVRRLFAPKTVSKVLTVKTSLSAPSVSTIHTIATIGRDSSRRVGETWSTEVSNSRWLTPYFRVNGDAVLNVDLNLAASTDYKTSVSADAISLIKRAAGVISPSSTLITSLNKDRFNDAANFVDGSINSFFKESIVERSVNDFRISDGNQVLGAIFLNLPGANETLADYRPVGVWVLSTDRVIASVFQPTLSGAQLIASAASMASVLNFQVSNEQTIQQALAAKASISTARDTFIRATGDANIQVAAAALCQALTVESEGFGLVPFDAKTVRLAYAKQLALQGTHRTALDTSCA